MSDSKDILEDLQQKTIEHLGLNDTQTKVLRGMMRSAVESGFSTEACMVAMLAFVCGFEAAKGLET